ncbi:ribosomal protein L7/L12 [Paractinoplanes brasiliensis]|uniref:Ribosomal L7/L12-like protein n=1 Tax=Paractinoplanes brasiliensis TaxID=52695 RepID=A0A4R6JYE2_9ACTN|nr:ribosomal protein L7/L12 [Actinoplanes brasiliensis]TDO41759.1 ribosomal L7/L12-like protein [Actinoplanes brasiliensis]GID29974.1 hypothetical protein Abr02nite_49570 [Actinoplanes brasiliensis]
MEVVYVVVIALATVGLTLFATASRSQRTSREAARLAAVERKLDMVMKHLGIEEPVDAADPEVLSHLMKGEKIHAIKIYRERTGAGLAEAKEAVERLARERGLS